MNALNTIKTSTNQKDIEKGQKILAAVYLITDHLSDSEPIRTSLRSVATSLVCASSQEAKEFVRKIEILLGGAVFAGLISEKNSSVIVYEVKHFYQSRLGEGLGTELEELFRKDESFGQLAGQGQKDIKKTYSHGLLSGPQRPASILSDIAKFEKNIINKGSRQDKILSFINDRKSAVIKDIVSLFPEVSEKTIQRELNVLIESGRITKRGSKRWSMYMAVNSLL
jgi:hypothetical protein